MNRGKILERLHQITEYAENFPFNSKYFADSASVGIIAGGFMNLKIDEALQQLQPNTSISRLNLGMTYPLNRRQIVEFLSFHETIIILEDLEPISNQPLNKSHLKKNYP